uniref:Transforming growth factor, alpha n=1 Tax=Amphilophus citrinellus TaxID=61819 RepID=A0A3Q0SEQ7_AMPCI
SDTSLAEPALTFTSICTTVARLNTNIIVSTEFVAAAVRSHFDDCPDSHRHFCFHGTCRFLILEATPSCVCHPGFVGMRCEHADLLAVVATNHRQQTMATVLVLCVIGCVLIMVLSLHIMLCLIFICLALKPRRIASKVVQQARREALIQYLLCD